jgi:hypothetical protein
MAHDLSINLCAKSQAIRLFAQQRGSGYALSNYLLDERYQTGIAALGLALLHLVRPARRETSVLRRPIAGLQRWRSTMHWERPSKRW